MKSTTRFALLAVSLGLFAIIMVSTAFLALLDIAMDREPDLTLEWLSVWVAVVVVLSAQIISLVAIFALMHRGRQGDR